jgi:hypothetical protein
LERPKNFGSGPKYFIRGLVFGFSIINCSALVQ